MARSEEALKRRAEKRQRSLHEQKQVDFEDVKKRQKLEYEKRMGIQNNNNNGPRSFQGRPPPRYNDNSNYSRPTKKQPRHDPETSKALVWAQQADQDKVQQNQALRRKYHETGGKGMDPEELERAKLLIARDERKKQKKEMKKQKKQAADGEEVQAVDENKKEQQANNEEAEENDATKETSDKNAIQEDSVSSNQNQKEPSEDNKKEQHDAKSKEKAKSKRDKNRALRKRYQETDGKGMSGEDIRRAKQLLERDERKKQKRAAAAVETKQ